MDRDEQVIIKAQGLYTAIPDDQVVIKVLLIPCGIVNDNHDIYSKEAIAKVCANFKPELVRVFRRYGDSDDITKIIGSVMNLTTDEKGNAIVTVQIDSKWATEDKDKESINTLIKTIAEHPDWFRVALAWKCGEEDETKDENGNNVIHGGELTHCALYHSADWAWADKVIIGVQVTTELIQKTQELSQTFRR